MADSMNGPELDADTICRIVVKMHQFVAKEAAVEEDYGANQVDEGFRPVLESFPDDPVFHELRTFIRDLDVDRQCELVALTWIGRGDYGKDEWEKALDLARHEHSERTAEYPLGTPQLADYLEDGMAEFGMSCRDFERDRL